MLIFHSGYLDDYILNYSSLLIPRTKEVVFLTDKQIKQQLNEKHIDLKSFKHKSKASSTFQYWKKLFL
ncbi:hypothetical protein [Oceanobacillus sp. J11TS1]|uniref:hypothetical protein n=1 Tax=Oceanobacillus sp. J11TS1 TaxID=2807191 RepID=UPI001B0CB993|nr:hypothetical protein [Oceanobacillus sp. J11TS1]GIO23518.1 hypothetical protein J11TS1_20990 [Oceanobacillus sp. J11TS1]